MPTASGHPTCMYGQSSLDKIAGPTKAACAVHVHELGHGGVVAGAEDGADGVAGRRPGAAGQAAHAQDAAHFESFKGGCNCIKICLPGKLILRDYFQENRTSRRPFLLVRISFPGRPIFIQLVPAHLVF